MNHRYAFYQLHAIISIRAANWRGNRWLKQGSTETNPDVIPHTQFREEEFFEPKKLLEVKARRSPCVVVGSAMPWNEDGLIESESPSPMRKPMITKHL